MKEQILKIDTLPTYESLSDKIVNSDTEIEVRRANGVDNEAKEAGDEILTFTQVFKHISGLSLPMALSFTFSFEIFLIVIMLNYLNDDDQNAIAATTLITTLINTLTIIGMSPLFALSNVASGKIGQLMAAENDGEENEDQLQGRRVAISEINQNGFLLASLLTFPVIGGLIFSKKILVDVFHQDDNVAQISQDFLRVYSFSIPGLMTRMSSEQMMFCFERATPAMLLALASLGVGSGVSILLGFGHLGFPKLGATGVAIGCVVEAYLTSLLYTLYLAMHKDFNKFDFFNLCKRMEDRLKKWGEILSIGKSITFSNAIEMGISLAIGVLSGLVGTREQSAMTFVNQFVYFNFIFLAAFGQSCSQEVNRQIGAKKFNNASQMGKYGLLTTIIYTASVPIFFGAVPGLLTFASTNKDDIKSILKYLAPIISAGVITDSIRYNLLQQLRVLGDLRGSTIVSVSGLSASMGMAAFLGLKTNMGIYGVAAGSTAGITLTGLGLFYRWKNRIAPEKIKCLVNAPPTQDSLMDCLSTLFRRRSRQSSSMRILQQDPPANSNQMGYK